MSSIIRDKRAIGIVLTAILLIVFYFLPNPEGLTQEAKMAVVLLFAGLILWMTDAMPTGVSALLLMALMPYFGIFSFSELWKQFISSAFFFIMVSFAISAALGNTSIPIRISAIFLKKLGSNSRLLVLGFMIISAVISMVCANIGTIAMMMSFTTGLLQANGCEPKKSGLGKCLMIGVAFAAMLGGCSTLCGSSSHIMLLDITMQNYNGFSVNFVDWMIVSMPVLIILLPLTWWWLCKIYKPELIAPEAIETTLHTVKELGPMQRKEKLFIVFLCALFSCWILSTWFSYFNMTTTSLIGLAIMFCPGIKFIDRETFLSKISWNVLLMVGGVIALTAGMAKTGGMTWFVNQVAPFFMNTGDTWIYIFASVFCCVAHCIIPSGSATAAIATIPLMELCKLTGANATTIFHTIGWWAGGAFITPIDTLILIVYSYGYIDFKDPIKAGIVPCIGLIILSSTLTPWIIHTFNIGMQLM